MHSCTIIILTGGLEGKYLELNGLFQYSINNALELFIVFDKKGKIVYANRTAEENLEYTIINRMIKDVSKIEIPNGCCV